MKGKLLCCTFKALKCLSIRVLGFAKTSYPPLSCRILIHSSKDPLCLRKIPCTRVHSSGPAYATFSNSLGKSFLDILLHVEYGLNLQWGPLCFIWLDASIIGLRSMMKIKLNDFVLQCLHWMLESRDASCAASATAQSFFYMWISKWNIYFIMLLATNTWLKKSREITS